MKYDKRELRDALQTLRSKGVGVYAIEEGPDGSPLVWISSEPKIRFILEIASDTLTLTATKNGRTMYVKYNKNWASYDVISRCMHYRETGHEFWIMK